MLDDRGDDMYDDAQQQMETLLRHFPASFAAAQMLGPATTAHFLNHLGDDCFFLASVFFHGCFSPLFGLAWAAPLAGASDDLEGILSRDDVDSTSTKQLLVSVCQSRLGDIHSILSQRPPATSSTEVFAAWRSGTLPIGLIVGTHFTQPHLNQVQVEIGSPVATHLRALQLDLPRLDRLDFATRALAYADAGILCYLAAAGYYIWADSPKGFVRVLASLDVISAAVSISGAFLVPLADHYASLEERCALGNAFPFLFAPSEAP